MATNRGTLELALKKYHEQFDGLNDAQIAAGLQFDLRAPCRDCPFKRTTKPHPGVARYLPAVIAQLMGGDTSHSCHQTDPRADSPIGRKHTGPIQHCAGFMIAAQNARIRTETMDMAIANGRLNPAA